MLSVSKVRHGGERYYLATSGWREGGGLVEPAGFWIGSALGPTSAVGVDGQRLGALFAGVDPLTGEILDRRHDRTRVAAFDCTFAAPKSVSVLHALGCGDVGATVRAAHDASVDAALGYLERQAARVRRGRDGAPATPASGFAGAAFVHRTSRAPDPHLHSHVLVANLGCDADGRWSALDARALYLHAGAAGALYRAQLRCELVERLGVCWTARRDGFGDLAGLPRPLLAAFSRRQAEIAAELEHSGRAGRRARRIAADATRPAKALDRPYEDLVGEWLRRAEALGLSPARLEKVAPGPRRERGVDAGALAAESQRELDAFERPCTRRELLAATCRRLTEGARVADLECHVDALLDSPGRAVSAERRCDRLGRSGRRFPGEPERRYSGPVLMERLAMLDRRFATAPDLAEVGVGSSTSELGLVVAGRRDDPLDLAERLTALAARARREGRDVIGLASSDRRAAHLEAVTGIASMRLRPEHALAANALLVVDPGPDRGSLALERVLEAAGERRSVVVFAPASMARGLSLARPQDVAPPLARERVGEHEVVFAGRPLAAVAALRRRRAEIVARGRPALVVTADPRMLGALGPGAVASGEVGEALRRQPATELVVLGGANVLAPEARRLARRRTHVLVVAGELEPTARRAWALEVLGERARQRTLGRERVLGR